MEPRPERMSCARSARLGSRHGYRFDGDTVYLDLMVRVVDPVAHERIWSLQLWACADVPAAGDALTGHLVAHVSLPPIGELADEIEHFEAAANASVPAGDGEHVMVLALVSSGDEGGSVDDLFVYPRRESFLQPRLGGHLGYSIDGDRVHLTVETIRNPRDEQNTSGTLSIELWALATRYEGGGFSGIPLAGVELGTLSGQSEHAVRSFDLCYSAPPEGLWHLVLMLREWTPIGFLTRDYANFNEPMRVTRPEASAPAGDGHRDAAEPQVEDTHGAVEVVAAAAEVSSAVTPEAASSGPKAGSGNDSAEAPATDLPGVSVNHAPIEELRRIKGLPRKVADAIVSKRPFASLEELTRVKGIGAKLLARLRASLRL